MEKQNSNEHPAPACVVNGTAVVAKLPTPLVSNGKGLILRTVDEMWRLADIMAKAGMAPKGLETPQKLMIAIEHGQEYGIPAVQAIKCTKVINGVPSFYGEMPLALVRRSNLMEYIKESRTGEGDAMMATCETKRKDDGECVSRSFSVADAKKAGLWNKSGPWSNYPKRMLQMRARSWCLNDNFPEVLMGMTIAEEYEGVNIDVYDPKNMPQTKVREDRTEEEPDTRTLDMAMRELRELFISKSRPLWPGGMADSEIVEHANDMALMNFAAFKHGGAWADYSKPPKNWTMQKCDDMIAELDNTGIPLAVINENFIPLLKSNAKPKAKPKLKSKPTPPDSELPPEPDADEPPPEEPKGDLFDE